MLDSNFDQASAAGLNDSDFTAADLAAETHANDTVNQASPLEKLSAELSHEAPMPTPTAPAQPNGFALMGLAPELLQAVADLGFTQPTTVQARVIPSAMQTPESKRCVDLMVSSQTGSGKTAAFLLPVLHTIQIELAAQAEAETKEWDEKVAAAAAAGDAAPKRPKRRAPTDSRSFKPAEPTALVLCPTRELAQQVADDGINLVRHMRGVRIACVVGGIPYGLQISRLQNANLVVATPGRLLDLQNSGQLKLDKVQFLVVDEADRMLDLGFAEDLATVNQLTIGRRQTMMFSATFAPRIQQLATRVMREPQRVQVDSPQEKHQNITQSLHWADNRAHKRKLLDHWLRDESIEQAIVFASTQIECDDLANDLQQDGFSAVGLHGALNQGMRNRRLTAFREGRVQFLVATDVAARGLDVPSISHVFNYGLPMKSEDYVHRIGRTGRAGRNGFAVTFAEFRERRKILDIEHYTQQQLKANVIEGLAPTQGFERGSDRGGAKKKPFGRSGGGFGGGGSGFGGDRGGFGGDRGGDRGSFGGGAGGGFGRPSSPYAGKTSFNKPYGPAAGAERGNDRGGFADRGGERPNFDRAPAERNPFEKPFGDRAPAPKSFGAPGGTGRFSHAAPKPHGAREGGFGASNTGGGFAARDARSAGAPPRGPRFAPGNNSVKTVRVR
jgi:superfamily II DNA/RNA helicase